MTAVPFVSDIDPSKPVAGDASTPHERLNWQHAKDEAEAQMAKTGDYYTPRELGFVEGAGNDNTAAFATMHDLLADTSTRKRVLWDMKGDFWADEIALLPGEDEGGSASVSIRGGPKIICAGEITANWRSNPGTGKKVFCYSQRGYIQYWGLSGIRILGNASTPNQIGLFLCGEPKAIPGADGAYGGGLRNGRIDDVIVQGFTGHQIVVRGGISDYLCPTDLNIWNNIGVYRPSGNHWPAMMFVGQYGQGEHNNFYVSGASNNNAGPHIYMGPHPSFDMEGPVTNVLTSVMTSSAPCRGWTGQPVRAILRGGGSLPAGALAKGVTYFLVTKNRSTVCFDFGVATTAALAFAGTTLVSVTGTSPTVYFVKLWATALSANEYTTEFSHLLTTGDWIRFRGTSFPTVASGSVADGDRYWVIKTDWDKFKLATSLSNAKTRTSTTISGGTFADYGFQVQGPAGETGFTSVNPKFTHLSTGSGQNGMMIHSCTGVEVEPYFEGLSSHGFQVIGPRVSGGQGDGSPAPNLVVRGGRMAMPGPLLYAEGVGMVVDWDYDATEFAATGSALHLYNSAMATVKNTRQQGVGWSASPSTIDWRKGAIINFGTLTGNVTSFAFDVTTLVPGCKLQVNFLQGAGGHTVVLGGIWKGPALGSGTAGQKLMVEGFFDGDDILYDTAGWDSARADIAGLAGYFTTIPAGSTTIAALNIAIAAAPAGAVFLFLAGNPTTNTGIILVTRENITLQGSGMPEVVAGALSGGTIVIGAIAISARNVIVSHLGVDQTTIANNYTSAITFLLANDTDLCDGECHHVNVIGRGNANSSTHGILFQTGTNFKLHHFKATLFAHGAAMRGNNAHVSDGECIDTDLSAVVFRADTSGTANNCQDGYCNNVMAIAVTAGKAASFIADCSSSTKILRRITFEDCTSYNGTGDAFTTTRANSGVPDGVKFNRCHAIGALTGGNGQGAGFFLSAGTINTQVTNSIARGCAGWSYICSSGATVADNNNGSNNLSISTGAGECFGIWSSQQINGFHRKMASFGPADAGGNNLSGLIGGVAAGALSNNSGAEVRMYAGTGGANLYKDWRSFASTTIWSRQYNPTTKAFGAEASADFTVTHDILDVNGNITAVHAAANTGWSYQVPVTGFSVVMGNNIPGIVFNPAGTLAAGTTALPTTPIDGQLATLVSTQIITTFTVNASAGQSIIGGGALTIAAGGKLSWRYRLSDTTWYPG